METTKVRIEITKKDVLLGAEDIQYMKRDERLANRGLKKWSEVRCEGYVGPLYRAISRALDMENIYVALDAFYFVHPKYFHPCFPPAYSLLLSNRVKFPNFVIDWKKKFDRHGKKVKQLMPIFLDVPQIEFPDEPHVAEDDEIYIDEKLKRRHTLYICEALEDEEDEEVNDES